MSSKSKIVAHGKNYFTVYDSDQFMAVIEQLWNSDENTRGIHHNVTDAPTEYPITIHAYIKYGTASDDPLYASWYTLDLKLLQDIVATRFEDPIREMQSSKYQKPGDRSIFTQIGLGQYLIVNERGLRAARSSYIREAGGVELFLPRLANIPPMAYPQVVIFSLVETDAGDVTDIAYTTINVATLKRTIRAHE